MHSKEVFFREKLYQKGYLYLGKLAEGGCSVIYRIKRISDKKEFVLKLLSITKLKSKQKRECLQRFFQRKFQIYEQIQHPSIIQLQEYGYLDEVPYAIFEYIKGENLKQYLIQRRELSVSCFVNIMQQVLQTLVFIHSKKKYIHADLKPQNIMITNGKVKLIDFESGGFEEDFYLEQQEFHHSFISPRYTAPDQLKGKKPNYFSDIYAWAVIVLEFFLSNQHQLFQNKIPADLLKNRLGKLLKRILHDKELITANQLLNEFSQIDFTRINRTNDSIMKISSNLDHTCVILISS